MTAIDTVVADAVDRATAEFVSNSQASEQLSREFKTLDPATYDLIHLNAIRAAICFRLLPDGTFYGDFAGNETNPWPRTPEEMPAEVLDLWQAYADHVQSAALRAQLHDLLAAASASQRYVHARAAVSAYREAVPAFLVSAEKIRGQLRAVESLTRALDLAVSMNQRDLRDLVVRDTLGLAGDLLNELPVPSGLVYRLLEPLQSRHLEAGAVRGLIESACNLSVDNVQLHVAFLRLLRSSYADPAAQKDIDRRIVEAMVESAEASPRMLRLLTLNDAAVLARNAGLNDLFNDVNRKIQSMQLADLGLVPTTVVTVQLLPQELEAALAEVDQAADLAEALWRIAGTSAPAGDLTVAEHAARMLSANAPLASSIPRGRINPAGPVPVSSASGDGLANVQAMFQVLYLERRGLAVWAQLDRIRERFAPDEAALVSVFDHKVLGSGSKTRMLAHAFMHFWDQENDAAVHLALPRVESLLREIERDRGVSVVSVAQGSTPGGVSQLGALISAMPTAGFDENWKRSFALLLTDGEDGLNLRNNVGHGLCDCPPRHHVALVLHAALYLLAVAHGVVPLHEGQQEEHHADGEQHDGREQQLRQ
jgi:hypothetical protein